MQWAIQASSLAVALSTLSGCASDVPDHVVVAILADAPPRPTVVTCLRVSGRDPGPLLITALRHEDRPVVRASTCGTDRFGFVKSAGRPAEIVALDGFVQVGLRRANVRLSERSSRLAGSVWRIRVRRTDERWVIDGMTLESMQ